VDTYDTLEGVRRVIALSRRLGENFQVGAIRLDSGDLATLARESRRLLDAAGLAQVRIVASGNLDEYRVAALCRAGAPIDSFGVGTFVDVVADGPSLEAAYKLVAYAGKDCGKLSPGKLSLPGPKQVYRRFEDGRAVGDVIARNNEVLEGEPLLHCVMRDGRRLSTATGDLAAARVHLQSSLARLPSELRALDVAATPYPVTVSAALIAAQTRLRLAHGGAP
jgi:nicotinate phosphoribosyltransferase